MTTEEFIQKILERVRSVREELKDNAEGETVKSWALSDAVDDIEALCKEHLMKDNK